MEIKTVYRFWRWKIMLVEFKVKNFKSIKDELVFSMEKGEGTRTTKKTKYNTLEVNSKTSLLKNALVFGANASGKSNFLEALYALDYLIIRETRRVTSKLHYDSYGNSVEPTTFSVDFIKNNVRYHYYIQYDEMKIYSEILSANGKLVFDRESVKIKELRDNQTLIFYYQKNNQKESSEVFRWFAEDLIFESDSFGTRTSNLVNVLKKEEKKDKFLRIMKYADFNITNVEIIELPTPKVLIDFAEEHFDEGEDREKFINHNRQVTLNFTHKSEVGTTFSLVLNRESLGTRSAVNFILLMLSYDKNKVLLVDEFDTSFHLNLSKTFLSLINSEFQHSQFILTTHETELMDHNLRKDQIYFMEKDEDGASSMYSLYDFKQSESRNDVSYSKKYLAGRFGGLPVIDEEAILEVLGEDNG